MAGTAAAAICKELGAGAHWKGRGSSSSSKKGRGGPVPAVAMIREVVTVGTAAASVTSSGTHHVVLRVALATVTQVAVTAAVCYGAYLSPYAEGFKNRVKIVEESPGELMEFLSTSNHQIDRISRGVIELKGYCYN